MVQYSIIKIFRSFLKSAKRRQIWKDCQFGAVALPILSYIQDPKFHKEGHIWLQLDHAASNCYRRRTRVMKDNIKTTLLSSSSPLWPKAQTKATTWPRHHHLQKNQLRSKIVPKVQSSTSGAWSLLKQVQSLIGLTITMDPSDESAGYLEYLEWRCWKVDFRKPNYFTLSTRLCWFHVTT